MERGRVGRVSFEGDPTGFSSPLGQAVIILALLVSLVVLIRNFRNRR